LTFDPKINQVSGLLVEHFYIKLGDPSCIGFEIPCAKIDRQTNTDENHTTAADNDIIMAYLILNREIAFKKLK